MTIRRMKTLFGHACHQWECCHQSILIVKDPKTLDLYPTFPCDDIPKGLNFIRILYGYFLHSIEQYPIGF